MPRRSFLLRRVRLPAPGEAAIATYLRHWHARELHLAPETFPLLTSENLFGDSQPLELEIGCGTADFLTSLATRQPDTNFLGLDINLKSLMVATARVDSLGLRNIRFIKAPVQYLYPLMVSDSLRAVYLHFPDPNLRPKYRPRRILNEAFIGHVHRALVPGGTFSVVTDNEDVFMGLLQTVEEHPGFEKRHEARYLLGFEPEVKSRYQVYWESHGVPIYRFEVAKL